MAGERSPKRFDFRRKEARLLQQSRQLHMDALRIENELVLLLQQEWFLIQDYNIQMLQYLELQLTCEIMASSKTQRDEKTAKTFIANAIKERSLK
ncbi:unnamed protein product [Cercopithifilaria johnstoni]|uniref:Uncharacterized protein n=1 Tax=Cercopithifilaria johnstoni TaxID=2874296 RepID=A0A8J2MDC9_9BILA|nr:unnamed protein product [Cercopithifilaria johnstoni]